MLCSGVGQGAASGTDSEYNPLSATEENQVELDNLSKLMRSRMRAESLAEEEEETKQLVERCVNANTDTPACLFLSLLISLSAYFSPLLFIH